MYNIHTLYMRVYTHMYPYMTYNYISYTYSYIC